MTDQLPATTSLSRQCAMIKVKVVESFKASTKYAVPTPSLNALNALPKP